MKADTEVITEAKAGNIEAVGILYDRYHQDIFRFVLSRVHNYQLAEDLTGEVFTRMVQHLPNYRQLSLPFRAWLYRIASNLMVDHFRKEGNQTQLDIEHAPVTLGDSPALIVDRQLTMEAVQKALDKIDEVQRDVVLLRFIMGLPLAEVAQTLNRSVASIKTLQHRGLKSLRVALQSLE